METVDNTGLDSGDNDAFAIDYARYLQALRRYAWLVALIIAVSVAGAVLYTARQTPIYEATASVQVEPRLPDLLGTGDMFNVAAGGGNSAEYYRQQAKVLSSYTLCRQTVEQHALVEKILGVHDGASKEDQVAAAGRRLQASLRVRYPDQDRIFYVSVRGPDKELAATLANAVVQTYYDYSKGLLSLGSSEATNALQAEFNQAETKLRAAEQQIAKFLADNDMITMTLEERQNLLSQNISSFSQKINDQTAKEIELHARLAQMRKESGRDVLSNPVVMMGDSPSYSTLRSLYFNEKMRLVEVEKVLGPKHPDYLVQKRKVDELFEALKGEISILVDGTSNLQASATRTREALDAELEKYKNEAKALAPKILMYNDLLRQKKDLEDQYSILRSRLSTTQLTGNVSASISNVRPLDPAVTPSRPAWPSMRRNVAAAGAFALVLGVALVFLFVFFDRTIKTTSDAIQASGSTVLGIIPMLNEGDVMKNDDRSRDMYVHEHPTSRVAECCRSLRTNIMFSAADHPSKTIVVCSANPREGKTTSVIYLGTTMAQSGQRVLLIDTDMRRPRLHASTGVTRQRGLSNLMLGEEDYEGIIKTTDVPNLFVLPCGPLPPNPAELIMTKRFEHVLEELGRRFDRIILDSPPIQAVTDAVVLSRRTDGVILVVRAGRTLREELKRSARQIRDVGGSIFGVVVNELSNNEGGAYYYYSYYGPRAGDSEAGDKPAPKEKTAA